MNGMIVSMNQSQGSTAQIAGFFNAIRDALLSTPLTVILLILKKSMLRGKKNETTAISN